MELKTLLWTKPVLYFGILLLASRILRDPERQAGAMGRLGLLALGRVLGGMVLGTGALLFTGDLTGEDTRVVQLTTLAVVGFGLWFVTGKLAFRATPPKRLGWFAAAAEVVSLATNVVMLDAAEKIRFC